MRFLISALLLAAAIPVWPELQAAGPKTVLCISRTWQAPISSPEQRSS